MSRLSGRRLMTKPLPKHARVVIVGGGIIGASIAYHLTKFGWSDIVLSSASG